MITIDQERPCDSADIEKLLNTAFGPDRFTKSSYVLRENLTALTALSNVARLDGEMVGTIRYFPIQIRDLLGGQSENALLLGPLAVSPKAQGTGVGSKLITQTLSKARAMGHKRVLLVGDVDYYGRFGFESVLPRYITLPGGRDARRLLVWQAATISALPAVGKLLPGWAETAPARNWSLEGLRPAA
ncbi:MAG: GNAT family N-acetyltransferase [Kordiimonas sp.]